MVLCLSALLWACAAQAEIGPDQWLGGLVQYPAGIPASLVESNRFAGLRAEAIAGRFKIVCPAESLASSTRMVVYASADEPGHWRARDWQAYPAVRRGNLWDATVPVDDLDVPLIYFAVVEAPAVLPKSDASSPAAFVPSIISPLRIVKPRAAGLEEPSSVFEPYLEGFEEGFSSWRMLGADADAVPLRADAAARTGRAALCATVPAGKRSVTIATTCVRGRHLAQHQANGLRIYLRTRQGEGRARFTLQANAFAPNQVIATWPRETNLTEQWQKVDLFFHELPRMPLPAVDLLVIELIGRGPCEFLVDDVQLLGSWRLE